MFLRLLLAAFCLSACATKPALPPPPVAPAPLMPSSVRAAFPKEKVKQSAQLLDLLKASKVKALKSDGHSAYRAYDLSCIRAQEAMNCSYAPSADCTKVSCRKPAVRPEELSALLFDLPIAQGDSGAETRFVECIEYGHNEASCTVAIELDYEGP